MPILHRRFKKLKAVLDRRMTDLTVLIENVEKPHNLSAILRTCDAVGVLEVHAISKEDKPPTFNATAQGSQKWIKLNDYKNIEAAAAHLKSIGFKLYGTSLNEDSIDYRKCDFCGPTAFVLGAEKWGLSETGKALMDKNIFIPMRGMVQSLNVSVAASTLLFESLRQREEKGIVPLCGERIEKDHYNQILFEWSYPEVAQWCQKEGRKYPDINPLGEITEELPRTIKLRY